MWHRNPTTRASRDFGSFAVLATRTSRLTHVEYGLPFWPRCPAIRTASVEILLLKITLGTHVRFEVVAEEAKKLSGSAGSADVSRTRSSTNCSTD